VSRTGFRRTKVRLFLEAETVIIDLLAYGIECVAHGRIDLRQDRLSDLLSGAMPIDAADLAVVALDDGRIKRAGSVQIRRSDMCLVVATGPRGAATRRRATVGHPATLVVGPYRVAGRIILPPSADPLSAARRLSWFAVMDTTVHYRSAGRTVVENHVTMIVNQDHVSSMALTVDPSSIATLRPVASVAPNCMLVAATPHH
jgi:hypothetical protein